MTSPSPQLLNQVRKFLEPRWLAREADVMRLPDRDPISYGQCDLSAVFLGVLFGNGKLEGGYRWKNGHDRGEGGLDGELHYWWRLDNGTIVDITADQFGHPSVIVAPLNSPWQERYICTFDKAELTKVWLWWRPRCLELVDEYERQIAEETRGHCVGSR